MEEEFLDLLLKLVRELPLADIYQMDAQAPHQAPASSASRPKQSALEVSRDSSVSTVQLLAPVAC